MRHYYEPMGEDVAAMIADGVPRSPEAIGAALQGYQQAGVDELILDPSVPDPEQVGLLADVALA